MAWFSGNAERLKQATLKHLIGKLLRERAPHGFTVPGLLVYARDYGTELEPVAALAAFKQLADEGKIAQTEGDYWVWK